MIPFTRTLGFRLWLIAAFVITVPLIINIGIIEYGQYQAVIRKVKNNLQEEGLFKSGLLQALKPLNHSTVDFLITALDLGTDFPQTFDSELSRKLYTFFNDGFEEITLIRSTSKNGRHIVASSKDSLQIPLIHVNSENSFFIGLQKSDSDPNKILIITEALVYNSETNQQEGILYTSHDAGPLLDPILRRSSSIHALLFADDHLLAASEEMISTSPDLPILISSPNQGSGIRFIMNDNDFIGAVNKIPELNLTLISYQNYDSILNNLKKTVLIALLFLILSIPTLMLGYILTKRLSLPIRRLATIMAGAGENFSHFTPYNNDIFGFEINRLGQMFNSMIKTLLTKRSVAKTAEKEKNEGLAVLKLGQQAQDALLDTRVTDFGKLDIFKTYIPALSVSGDFYDIFMNQTQTDLFMIIADASDKGVLACSYSLEMKIILQVLLKETSKIEESVKKATRLFYNDTKESGMFVTAFISRYNYNTGSLSYYSCGHPSGIVLHQNNAITVLQHHGTALGFMPEVNIIPCGDMMLSEGDKLILYSDGITEASNAADELFGVERLIKTLRETQDMNAEMTSKHIVNTVNEFVGRRQYQDDLTLLVIKVKGDYD